MLCNEAGIKCSYEKELEGFWFIFYRNNLDLIEINFWTNPEYSSDFDGKLDVDTLINNISLRFPNKIIEPTKSLIFFYEIQDCPKDINLKYIG